MARPGLLIAGVIAVLLHAVTLVWLAPHSLHLTPSAARWQARLLPPSSEPVSAIEPTTQEPVFFNTSDVDRAAHPQDDWRIPTQGLTPQQLYRAHVELWVDAQGTIVKHRVHSLTPNDIKARQALQHIIETPMTVATKQGVAVGNRRQLEIFFGLEP